MKSRLLFSEPEPASQDTAGISSRQVIYVAIGCVSVLFWVLMFAAWDDLTTSHDNPTGAERLVLVISAVWASVLSLIVFFRHHPLTGLLSFGFLALGIWGAPSLLSEPVEKVLPDYLAVLTGCFWFLIVSVGFLFAGLSGWWKSDFSGSETL